MTFQHDLAALHEVQFLLWAVRVLSGSSIVDVCSPVTIVAILHLITTGLLSY